MKKSPSIGFVYLIAVLILLFLFFGWILKEGWFERINTTKQTGSDIEKWSSYLENIASSFPEKAKKIAFLREAADLRLGLNQPERALSILEKARNISPKDDMIERRIVQALDQSGAKDEASTLARDLFARGDRHWVTVSALLEGLREQPEYRLWTQLGEVLWNSDFPNKKALKNGKIMAIGFTPDFWTVDGKDGYLVIQGLPEEPVCPELVLSCYASTKELPITVTIDDGDRKIKYTFKTADRVRMPLRKIQAGERRLFAVSTDKVWKADSDRMLGVHIAVPETNCL